MIDGKREDVKRQRERWDYFPPDLINKQNSYNVTCSVRLAKFWTL